MITFTGGEPLLNTEAINDFLDICEFHKIGIGGFYIATNGSVFNDEVIKTLMRLYSECDDNEMSQVHISNTPYHDDYNDTDEIQKKIELLKQFKFVSDKDRLDYKYVIAEGNGKDVAELNGTIDKARIIKQTIPRDEEELNEGNIYLNVHGDVLTECDFSYESQDKHKLFNCHETTFEEWFKCRTNTQKQESTESSKKMTEESN